jgi:1-deoxy-D-xylulose-5-phosphate synthase
MVATAIAYPGPAAVRYPRGNGYGVPMDPDIKTLPIGEAELLSDGDDCAIVAIGSMVQPAMMAAEELAAEGISVAVLNARFVKPLDATRIIGLAERCRALVTVEEHARMGGFGSAVLESLSEAGIEVPTECLAVADELIEHGNSTKSTGLDVPDITAAVRRAVERRRSPEA